MLKVGVVGVGHMGKIHLNCLSGLDQVEVSGMFDINKGTLEALASLHGLQVFDSFESILSASDIIVIASPTLTHTEYTSKVIQAGKHAFVEKPVSVNVSEAKALLVLENGSGSVIQVDMVERFNPAWLAIQPHLLNLKFSNHIRLAPFTPRGADVSVVMDVMIHDLDLLLSVSNGLKYTVKAYGEKIITDNWDVVSATIAFENGWIARLTASRVAERKYRLMFASNEQSSFKIDMLNKQAFSKNGMILTPENETEHKEWEWVEEPVKSTNAIEEGLKCFISSVLNNKKVVVSLHDCVQSMQLAEAIEDCMNRE